MAFLRQKYWSGLLFPSPGDLLDPGIEPASPALASGFSIAEPPAKPKQPSLTSSIHGIFQARVLEWGAIAFSDREAWHAAIHGVAKSCT